MAETKKFSSKILYIIYIELYKNSLQFATKYDKININEINNTHREELPMTIQDMKVLICDDSMFARKKLNMTMTEFGVKEIYEATDGEEAIAKYNQYKPDVVFMDIIMPKVTGLEALKKIVEENPDAKVIMASSVGTQGHLKEALKAGATDFLQKPITDEDAKKILENIAEGVL